VGEYEPVQRARGSDQISGRHGEGLTGAASAQKSPLNFNAREIQGLQGAATQTQIFPDSMADQRH
jgi:hypothetical protein